MTQARARVAAVNAYLPAQKLDNAALLSTLQAPFVLPGPDRVERLCGIRERRVAASDEQSSDMAVAAAKPIIRSLNKSSIDLLLFAGACGDLIEPATGNIVQHKLGLSCPVMDIKNACNSFVSAMQVASAFIETGTFRRILIVNGEKPSDSVLRTYSSISEFMECLASLTLGDAAAAMLLEATEEPEQGILFQKFLSLGQHWNLCTVQGGGSLFPHTDSAYYFRENPGKLRSVIEKEVPALWKECKAEIAWEPEEIAWVFTHQVSESMIEDVADVIGVPRDRCVNVFPHLGNMAAASIPVCIASVQHTLKRGDKIVLAGIAAGVSLSVQAIIW